MKRHEDETTRTYKLLTPGTLVSHYKIIRRIGIGGMGEVYLADDTDLDRRAALKFLSSELCADEAHRTRFQRESQTVAKLNHPNIIIAYEVGEHEGRPYFATEYVHGKSLRTYLSQSELALLEILAIGVQICDGLEVAHSHGIVHGDIKPSNLLFSSLGHLKIVDFGVASVNMGPARPEPGTIRGTPEYFSPEQLQGEETDVRSDLFSLGVVLYEALTGRNPFRRSSEEEVFSAVLEISPPPLERFRSGIPDELQRIVNRLLEKQRDRRYQSANEVRADLMSLFRSLQSKDSMRFRRSMNRQPSIAVLPFSNLSSDRNQEYFCQGIADEIRGALARISGLRVAARVSSERVEQSDDDAVSMGRKLGVETILRGSVQKTSDHIRVSVRLADTVSGLQLWSNQYQQKVEDVFALQDEISSSIVQVLQVVLSSEEENRLPLGPTDSISAYDYYLRGRQFFHLRRKRSLEYARQLFERAVEIDTGFANAYAYLSFSCSFLAHFYGVEDQVTVALADEASRKAIQIAPSLSEARASRGFALWLLERYEDADREFETAIKLNAKQFDAHYLYGRSCFQRGELARAARLFEAASSIQDDHEAWYFAAQTYTAMNRDAEAKTAYMKALQAIERHLELNPDDARAVTFGAVAWCRLGDATKGLEWSERAIAIDPNDAGIRYNTACLYALEGLRDQAISHLEDAVKAGFAHRDWVDNDPDLNSLRDDPRFLALPWRE
ncbi:MAG: protein kinase [bacterium]